jgi:hypothetical protein
MDLVEFEPSESEVRAAQQNAGADWYRSPLITSALDPTNERLYELTNPFSAKGRGRFRVVGCGLRYECKPLDNASMTEFTLNFAERVTRGE